MTVKKQTRMRARPGTGGGGRYYRVEVRPKSGFEIFRYHDVGRPGHVKRLAGKRSSGSWADAAWLISKTDAHVRNGVLVADTAGARKVLKDIGPARLVRGSLFRGHPRRNVPERAKPTAAQRRARTRNIRAAQRARRTR
jgi:hypothetical protein